ncbi:uncharacterized protein LOC120090009 isoform X2 [Benincasa hispida]|uniref:uncharacterized protein LOC120090009 isoform X2 n=1 Tax=Benincasa hispida TaxID=102211 RepID=UPI00190076D5|nr:uncharacterized protein LOC120090009 isoform X2 [Benincasa hispida]
MSSFNHGSPLVPPNHSLVRSIEFPYSQFSQHIIFSFHKLPFFPFSLPSPILTSNGSINSSLLFAVPFGFLRQHLPRLTVGTKLNKSTSCKSLGELELEEVKGFMDLGFEFKKENLSPRMVKLLPGLQRLRTDQINKQNLEEEDDDDDDENDDDKKRDIARPYLSEAWTIKRSNSPLLNLRMPKVSSTSDMKKHLKSWAKTVAFEIQ